ncbi:hypothetical protein QBC43DRAFT_323814 [Cladorrhinum sp. PSN259]|nr:hypothetical protein QBC43DRAFT_323814 [Cladorrhinum sp. PSN259]
MCDQSLSWQLSLLSVIHTSQFSIAFKMKLATALLMALGPAIINAQMKMEQRHNSLLAIRNLIPWGGVALRHSTCPTGTDKCNSGCCPTGTGCNTRMVDFPVCCPDSTDCSAVVGNVPACAETSWTLWEWAGFRFCCGADETGTYKPGQGIACVPNNLPIATSIILPSIVQATGTATGAASSHAVGTTSSSPQGTQATGGGGSGSGSGGSGSSQGGDKSKSDAAAAATSSTTFPTGAIAAIAVLAALVAILGLVIAWLLYRAARSNRRDHMQQQPVVQGQGQHMSQQANDPTLHSKSTTPHQDYSGYTNPSPHEMHP